MIDVSTPTLSLLMKLGSIAVHTEEMLTVEGHIFDRVVLKTLLADPEVVEWMEAMTKQALLPVIRCVHKGSPVRHEQFYRVHKCDKCGQEYKVND